jgi:hypothetical protein
MQLCMDADLSKRCPASCRGDGGSALGRTRRCRGFLLDETRVALAHSHSERNSCRAGAATRSRIPWQWSKNNVRNINRWSLLIGAIVIAGAPARAAEDRDHLPSRFHGLWCGKGVQRTEADKAMERTRGNSCPASSADNFMRVTAHGFDTAEGSRCKVIDTAADRKGNQLTTFYCWDDAGIDKGRTITFWFSLIDGRLHTNETERRP